MRDIQAGAETVPYLLHHLLERSAKRYPNHDAVISKSHRITYGELEVRSNQLACVLAAHGIRNGDRVGIYLSKSIESVVAIFGVLKAGAAYVPIDPAAPARRVAFIIGNCEMKALVTSQNKVANLVGARPECASMACTVLTDEGGPGEDSVAPRPVSWREVLKSPSELPGAGSPIEQDLAYILYTSGSTGEPKGVMITHRASLTFVNWAYEYFGVEAVDRVASHAPLHFDLSIFDIFTTIKAGGAVVLIPEEISIFPMSLADFLEEQRITVCYTVPSVLTRLVLHGDLKRREFSSLREILFAGEVFPLKYLRQLKTLIPHAVYYNLYGPTETNVCTVYPVKDIPPERIDPVPIGKACANTEVFAVSDQSAVADPGEIGELFVRGPSLMKGYWGMPEKTREVLVRHWFDPTGEELVYRTGDLVRQDEDGNYVFVGRRDDMIKSRGYRIELGEIEATIYGHPGVEEVAVIAIPDEEIGNVIKAVVVLRARAEITLTDLQYFCSERIPRAMIPSIFAFCDSLPKTSTGKVDKTRLLKEHSEGS